MSNTWITHVNKTKKQYPQLHYSEILRLASQNYNKQPQQQQPQQRQPQQPQPQQQQPQPQQPQPQQPQPQQPRKPRKPRQPRQPKITQNNADDIQTINDIDIQEISLVQKTKQPLNNTIIPEKIKKPQKIPKKIQKQMMEQENRMLKMEALLNKNNITGY